MKEHTEFELGYLAGIIEGEGSFCVQEHVGEKLLDICLSVGNEAPQLLMWLERTFGGKVNLDNTSKGFRWNLRKTEALPILKRLEGKLLFKEQQRDSFVKLLETLKPPQSGVPMTEEEAAERVGLFLQHKKLMRLFREAKRGGREKGEVVMGLSGGLDSTTLLYYLKWMGYQPTTISVNYGQRHAKELERAKEIAKAAGVENTEVDLSCLRGLLPGSALTDSSVALPEEHYTHETQKLTVVPARIMIFISILGSVALARKVGYVAFGAHASDYAIYPDCRAPFVTMVEEALWKGNYEKVILLAPFLSFSKANIVFLANLLKVPMGSTWSCYAGDELHCGKCGTCTERKEAFQLAGVTDPTEYK